jgi:3-dehydroquinate synthase
MPDTNLECRVNLSARSYSIHVTTNALQSNDRIWSTVIESLKPFNHAAIIFDERVRTIAETIGQRLSANQIRTDLISVPSGESSKSIEQLGDLWNQLLECKSDRKSIVFAIGGGVIGDLAGFAAASFTRGLRLVQIPTTLLAMVDSSVGGKTGINLPTAKNIVGAFWQPSLVISDTSFLQTLPDREYASGLAEVVKYGVIMKSDFFDRLEILAPDLVARSHAALIEIVAQSCRCKADVVEEDELETTGRRAILNYGHTFGHAIEATEGYGAFLHGEAVSIGMAMAGQLAVHLNLFEASDLARQNALLSKLGLPIDFSGFDIDTLWKAMQNDKKVELGKLGFILPTKIGHVKRVENISLADLHSAFQRN